MGRRRNKGRNVTGILVLDKPRDRGSNESLQIVKRLFDARKAGHTGSLDKLASGLLPICLGEATKVSGYLLNANKRYVTSVRLGEKSTTGDAEGEIIERRPVQQLGEAEVNQVLEKFTGDIEQIPPMYSALKHQGQRLYKLAHQGKTVEREPRPVTIYSLEMLSLDGTNLEIDVRCSKGTYIRTLAEDIGEALGCGGRVETLRRVEAGPFVADQMIGFEELERVAEEGIGALDELLLPAESALDDLASLHLTESLAFYLSQGQPVLVPHSPTEGMVRLHRSGGEFIGVGEVLDDGRIAPRRLFASPIRNAT